jgi:hypothetical protein
MMRFASIILLSAYCLVSLLGHAGFTVVRGAAFEWISANHSARTATQESFGCQCGCSQNRAEMAVDEGDECPSGCPDECPGGCPDDCVVCHFFSLFKAQATTGCTPCVEFYSLDVQLFVARDIIVAFDCTLRPRPRAPPSLTA